MADDITLVVGADYSELTGLVKTAKQTKTVLSAVEKEFARTGNQAQYMASINALVHANNKLDKAARMSRSDIMKLGAQMRQEAKFADALARSMGNVEKASVKARKAQSDFSNTSRKGMRRVEILAQQAGYQVGDLAVQIQGGTNAAVALGQQGSQLLGFFGPAGAIAGAALAIGTGLIAPFIKGEKAAKGLTDRIKDLKAEIADIEGTQVLPQEQTDLLNEQEVLSTKLLNLETQLAQKKAVVDQFEEKRLTKSSMYFSALGEVSLVEEQILATEQKRSENSELLLTYQTALIDKRKALANQEERTLSQELALSQMKLQFGEDSVAVRLLENQHIVENYREELRRLGLHKTMIDRLVEMKSLTLDNNGALESSSNSAKTLAQALREAVSAMSSLSGFSDNLDKKLAVSVAKVQALKSGADAAVAGSIAAMRADLAQKISAAKSSGVDSGIVERMYGGLRGRISDYETSETERKRLEKANRSSSRGSRTTKTALKDPLAELNKRITLDEKLLGVSKERETVLRAIANSDKEYSDAAINGAISRLEAYNKEKELLEEAAAQQQNIADTLKNSMEDAFMSIVDGTKSAEDAFKDMARMIISELYRVLVVQQMVGSFKANGGGILGSIFGAIGKRASGGTVMSNQPYLVGEKGPEVIVPQNRGHVMNADLTAKAMGGSGEAVVVNQTFNFAANGDDSVKKLIAQAAPQIAQMTQKQIMDSRRRGGAMKSTFG